MGFLTTTALLMACASASAYSACRTITVNYFGHPYEVHRVGEGYVDADRPCNGTKYTYKSNKVEGEPFFTLTFYTMAGMTTTLTVTNGPDIGLQDAQKKLIPTKDYAEWTINAGVYLSRGYPHGENVLNNLGLGWRLPLPKGWIKGDKYDSEGHCDTCYFDEEGTDMGTHHPRQVGFYNIVLTRPGC